MKKLLLVILCLGGCLGGPADETVAFWSECRSSLDNATINCNEVCALEAAVTSWCEVAWGQDVGQAEFFITAQTCGVDTPYGYAQQNEDVFEWPSPFTYRCCCEEVHHERP